MRCCEGCQEALPDDARYCSRCGHEVSLEGDKPGYRKATLADISEEPFSEALVRGQLGLQTEVNWAMVEPTLVLPPIPETPTPESLLEPAPFPAFHSTSDASIFNPITPMSPSRADDDADLADVFNMPTQSMPAVQLELPSGLLPAVQTASVEQEMLPVTTAPAPSTARQRLWRRSLIACMTFLLIVSGVAGAFLLSFSPTLSFEGSSSVATGGILRIHGSGFFPGSRVSLLLDSRVPLTTGIASSIGKGKQQLDMASLAQLLASHQLPYQPSGDVVPASLSGQFDIAVMVDPRWLPGRHTILAVDNIGYRTTTVSFTILPRPAQLSFLPALLDFAQLEQGTKATLTLSLFNMGGSQMYWSATTGHAAWLHLSQETGAINPNNGQQLIYITADATHLSLGAYRATLRLFSDGGQIALPIHAQVVPFGTKSPDLQVAPTTLSFGQVEQGSQATLSVAISNTGAQTLHWRVRAVHMPWLALASTSGSIPRGAHPQTMQVTVSTANLAPGSYTASLSVQSDGGNRKVTCLLTVVSPAPNIIILSPTPTLPPTLPPQPTVTSQLTPRVTASPHPSPSPTSTSTPTPDPTPTFTPTPTPTSSPTATPDPTPTATDTPSPDPTPTSTPTPTSPPTPTATPTPSSELTATATLMPESTDTPTPIPSLTALPSPTTSRIPHHHRR